MLLKSLRGGSCTLQLYSDGRLNIFSTYHLRENFSRWYVLDKDKIPRYPIYVRALIREMREEWIRYKRVVKSIRTIEKEK